MFKKIAVTIVTLGLSGAPALADPVSDVNKLISSLTTFTEADLAAALSDANAHGDKPAAQCYSGAIDYIQTHPVSVPALPSVVGAVSAFQATRDGVKFAEANQGLPQVPDEINQACGWLALDVQKDAAKVTSNGINFFGLFRL